MLILGIILSLIMGFLLGFIVAAIFASNRISYFEDNLIMKKSKIIDLKSRVQNRNNLIKNQMEEITKLKNELADGKSH